MLFKKEQRSRKGAKGKKAQGRKFLRTNSLFILLSLFLLSCVADPQVPEQQPVNGLAEGVIVVDQGIWRQDNSTLTFYDPTANNAIPNWFSRQNPGGRLGDSGNEIIIWNNRAFVAVSESATIEVIALPTGHSVGRIRLPSGTFPQDIVIVNDSTGWVSNLEDDSIIEFDPATLEIGRRVPVGPAPEGIEYAAGQLFVANSGLGALRAKESGAGTISVVDMKEGTEGNRIDIGGDLRDLHYFPQNGLLYVFVGASLPDTSGSGVVEIDPVARTINHRWQISGAWDVAFDDISQRIYIVAQGGVFQIDIAGNSSLPQSFLHEPFSTLNAEVPHGIAVSPYSGELFIGVARGYYTAPGRVDRYSRDGALLGSFQAGLNPTAFGFYE